MPAVKKTPAKKAPAAKKATATIKPLVLKKQTVADIALLLKYSKTRQSKEVCVA